jgi:hypothetical protein
MPRALVILRSDADRETVCRWAKSPKLPLGSRILFQSPQRSTAQNSMMWGLLTEVAAQKEHHGRKYTAAIWKSLFLSALGREVEYVPSLDSDELLVPIPLSSSELSVTEMNELIEFIIAWSAQNGVKLHDG